MLPILLDRVLFSMEGQACLRGPGPSSALLSSGMSKSALRRPHWDRPGKSLPFEVVICPNLWEGHQIEMSFDSDREPLLLADWAAFREKRGRDWDIYRQRKWEEQSWMFYFITLAVTVKKKKGGGPSLILSRQWDSCGYTSLISSPLSISWILPWCDLQIHKMSSLE